MIVELPHHKDGLGITPLPEWQHFTVRLLNWFLSWVRLLPANQGIIGLACAQAVALRGAPTNRASHVAAPRDLPPLHMAYDDHDRNVSHIHGFAQDM